MAEIRTKSGRSGNSDDECPSLAPTFTHKQICFLLILVLEITPDPKTFIIHRTNKLYL